ncbi:MAG: hypothetical protein ACYS9T_07850 [Planctomycetota bacterium]|jgi:hypothetical protein
MQTAASSNDQVVLAKLAIQDRDEGVRKAAVARLSDQKTLARVVINAWHEDVQKVALDKLSDQACLTKVALEATPDEVCKAAVRKLSDQESLTKVALEARSNEVREAAINDLTDQAVLYRVACTEKELAIRTLAVSRMTDQPLLIKLASEQPAAAIRLAAVSQVTDDDFLLQRSREDISNAVQMAAVQAIKTESYLARVAIENDKQAQREAALRRVSDPALRRQIDIAEQQRMTELAEIEGQTHEEALAHSALQGKFDVIRLAAARRLQQQTVLGKVAIESRDRKVCEIVFDKLTDQNVLLGVAANAADNAMRTAAKVKAGQTTWIKVFDKASAKGSSLVALGEALAAVALFPQQTDAKDGVVQACLNFIRHGDETRIPELVDLLGKYGDVTLAEDYLNCGQPDLDSTARQWARNHGYDVGTGAGSHRAAWGSDR